MADLAAGLDDVAAAQDDLAAGQDDLQGQVDDLAAGLDDANASLEGLSSQVSDLTDAVATAVINKRAGGMGLISGRKAFQRPMGEGIELLNAIQDVYLDPQVTIA